MMMLQSCDHNNLFTSIFVDQSEYASLIIKLLLVLESEKLIPLFEINDEGLNSGITAQVTNCNQEVMLVKDIVTQMGKKNQSFGVVLWL